MEDRKIIVGAIVRKFGKRFSITKEFERRDGRLYARIRQRRLRAPGDGGIAR